MAKQQNRIRIRAEYDTGITREVEYTLKTKGELTILFEDLKDRAWQPGAACTCTKCPTCHERMVCAECHQCTRCGEHIPATCVGCPA